MIFHDIRITKQMDSVTERRMICSEKWYYAGVITNANTGTGDDRYHIFWSITKGDPNITDGDEPFYQKLDAEFLFRLQEIGTEDDPYVYRGQRYQEKVTVMGYSFNKLGDTVLMEPKLLIRIGYWYHLEFHQNDTIAVILIMTTSCTGALLYLMTWKFSGETSIWYRGWNLHWHECR